MIERTVYQCEHCKANKQHPKILFSKNAMRNHETICFYNEQNKTCFTCCNNSNDRRNKCLFDKNKRFSECVEYCKVIGINPEKEFESWTISMKVMTNCEHWEQRESWDNED